MPGQPRSPQAAQIVVEVAVHRIEVAHLDDAGRFGSLAQPLRRAGSGGVAVARDVETLHATGQLEGGEVVGRKPGHYRHAGQDGPHGEHRLETLARREQMGRRAAEADAVAELLTQRAARRPDRGEAASQGVEPRAVDADYGPMHVRDRGEERRPGLAWSLVGDANVAGRVVAQP